MSTEYQVLARKYRPQTFKDVLGQDHIVQTLKNAIKNHRLAHAYLFCGSRGTGKTTLARVFAKALNCERPTADQEPCNTCSSCKEITSGNSLDVLEIDGASHRGIDDVRQINETVGYTAASGKYKIYIIDEVHMLTKEAFNALLKTLEEPPPKVKFFFATTEPHKVLQTILSRCQRFNLNRIPLQNIVSKLKFICQQQGVDIEEEAARLLAQRAEGGLRDAESLLDQIIAFQEGKISVAIIADILGVMPRETFFALDRAGKEGNIGKAFEVADAIFSQGKDLHHFLDGLAEHFRILMMIKVSGRNVPFLTLTDDERDSYEAAAALYTQEQCLSLLEIITEAQQQIRFMPAPRIALECILLKVLRVHQRLPIEFLVRRLAELENNLGAASESPPAENPVLPPENKTISVPLPKTSQPLLQPPPEPGTIPKALAQASPQDLSKEKAESDKSSATLKAVEPPKAPVQAPPPLLSKEKAGLEQSVALPAAPMSITEDPTPSPSDLGKSPAPAVNRTLPASNEDARKKQSQYDTLLQFAAVELEGTLKKTAFGLNKG